MKLNPRISIPKLVHLVILLALLVQACSFGGPKGSPTPSVTEIVAPPSDTDSVARPSSTPESPITSETSQASAGPAPSADRISWQKSLIFDPNAVGQPLPISIMQIVAHQGRLYAGSSADGESGNYSQRSAYIFVKKDAGSGWEVDANFGPNTEQVNFLYNARLENGPDGQPLPDGPVELLLAGTNHLRPAGASVARLRVRDDQANQWIVTELPTPKPKDHAIRSAVVYRDTVLNVDLVFIAANPAPLGVYAGFFDPNMPGKLRWSNKPELVERPPEGAVEARGADLVYSLAVVNDSLYAATGRGIYRRTVDGLEPEWSKVLDLPPDPGQPDFEVRGLTAVHNPKENTGWNEDQILIFSTAMGLWRMRCPADPTAEHTRQQEIDLLRKISEWTGQPVFMGFTAFTPLTAYPNTAQPQFWITGVQVIFATPGMTPNMNDQSSIRYEPQAYYLIRDLQGNYQLGQVLDPTDPTRSIYLARTFAVSPFPGEENILYTGGFSSFFARGLLGTAWIYRGTLNP